MGNLNGYFLLWRLNRLV